MKVSVVMITYNQSDFIAQAIESVLMQETDFDFELVIGEDCSTDGTREIVAEYARRYPDKIRATLNEKNLTATPNFIQTYKSCQGEYIALLEGDDFWTSPHKLQKQVDFFRDHPECTVCGHRVNLMQDDNQSPPSLSPSPCPEPISTLETLVEDNFLPTASVMYRGGLIHGFPFWFTTLTNADWVLHILHAHHGRIGFLPDVMSTYRVHSGGIWSLIDRQKKRRLSTHTLFCLDKILQGSARRINKRKLAVYQERCSRDCASRGEPREAWGYAFRSMLNSRSIKDFSRQRILCFLKSTAALCPAIFRSAYRRSLRLMRRSVKT